MMTQSQIDRAELKEIVHEVLQEHPELILQALQGSVKAETRAEEESVDYIDLNEVRDLVKSDFDRYDAVFRALA